MSRAFWLGLGLILLSNAVALVGVWYNRSGEPLAQLQLSERELRVPYDSWLRGEENSVLSLELVWRQSNEGGRLGWLDEAKLRELGFEPGQLGHGSARPIWLVLELDGPSYRKLVQGAEAALVTAEAALLERPKDDALLRQRDERRGDLRHERQVSSRLLLVDVGLDIEALRRAWPDRHKHVVLAARLTPYQSGTGPSYSAGIQLDGDRISVPRQYREIFAEWRQYRYEEKKPRVQVEVAFGQRHEPWLISASQ